jgi:hypothetical protein
MSGIRYTEILSGCWRDVYGYRVLETWIEPKVYLVSYLEVDVNYMLLIGNNQAHKNLRSLTFQFWK